MSQVQSWQIQCRKCGWANSGAEVRCGKCGFALPHRPGMLVAGQSLAAAVSAPRLKVAQPAGFWVRFVAFLIDWAILEAVAIAVYFVWKGTLTPAQIDPNHLSASLQTNAAIQTLVYELAVSLVYLFYFVGSWTILGASPAQRIFNLHIIGKNGEPVGFWRAWLRYIMMSWFALPSIFFVAFSKSKRGIHDLLAGTYVIQYLDPERIQGHPAQQLPPGLTPPGTVGSNPTGQIAPGAAVSPEAGAALAAAGTTLAAAASSPSAEPAPPPAQMPEPDAAPAPAMAQVASPVLVAVAAAGEPQPGLAAAPVVAQPPPSPPPATRAPVPPPVFPEVGAPVSGPAPVPIPAAVPPAPPIDAVPPQVFESPPPPGPEAPPMAPMPSSPPQGAEPNETAGGREIYSPSPGTVPMPPTINPYPLPFTGAQPALPPVEPPPHPADQEGPSA